jgi:hypothetical protein
MSDNIALKYLFDKQNLNARQARWLAFLSEYDFEIRHIKGKENKVVDALRRHANLIYTITRSNYETDLEEKVKIAAEKDIEYQNIKSKLTENQVEMKNQTSDFLKMDC